jgi:hypothetical protein
VKALVRLMAVPTGKRDAAWVDEALRAAVQLELSTIPPYLYAMWSVDMAADPDNCASVIRSIAVEEMLHMGIACNLLTALGGRPDILALAPSYPARLPKDVHKGLEVALAPLSKDVLLKTFMAIEEPTDLLVEDPDFVPSHTTLIGQFYDEMLAQLPSDSSAYSTTNQVDLSGWFGAPFTITSLEEATSAIDLIKRQGEGTSAGPFEHKDDTTELAHFYQFGEIYHGQRLTRTAPFTYTGDAVTTPVVRAVQPASAVLPEAKAFDLAYSNVLRALQAVWDSGGDITDAVTPMFTLPVNELLATGFGPAFRVVDASGEPVLPLQPKGIRFGRILEILDAAVGSTPVHGHGTFWRGLTRDQFVAKSVAGKQLLVVGSGRDSNLVKALRGQLPFGKDLGVPGASLARMPARRDPVPGADIDLIEQWIDDGCPDDVPAGADSQASLAVEVSRVSLTTGAFRPDPMVHVAYFRDLDNWSMYQATDEVRAAIEIAFGAGWLWMEYAKDASREQIWLDALADEATRRAIGMLAARQQHTVEVHYGVPVPLLTVLDGFERFGNNGLPDDPQRPEDPRHTMNDEVMWFVLCAFAEACVRLDISAEFWTFFQRPVLCGLLNDGLFRGRFRVEGFDATPEGREAIYAFVQQVAETDLPGEIRKRYAGSGL